MIEYVYLFFELLVIEWNKKEGERNGLIIFIVDYSLFVLIN